MRHIDFRNLGVHLFEVGRQSSIQFGCLIRHLRGEIYSLAQIGTEVVKEAVPGFVGSDQFEIPIVDGGSRADGIAVVVRKMRDECLTRPINRTLANI